MHRINDNNKVAKMESHEKITNQINDGDSSKVLAEYLELFTCLGHRYKYFLAPNAVLDWFGHSRSGPLKIHEFFLEKFGSKCQHGNFDKITNCNPIEKTIYHMRTKHLPTFEVDIIHSKNLVTHAGISSLKLRAESDVDEDDNADVGMEIPSTIKELGSQITPTTSKTTEESEESDDCSASKSKRLKQNTPPATPFKYLKRLPSKKKTFVGGISSDDDDDSSDDEDFQQKKQSQRKRINASDFSPLHYLEAIGILRKTSPRHLGGGFKECPIRLKISYRKNLTNQTIQFALIIYERLDQQQIKQTIRSQRKLDFSKCVEDEDLSVNEDSDCMDTQPAVIMSNDVGDEQETLTIATVETPNSAEIATALEEAAFTIQQPIHRTPTKATPIPPGTPKRRVRSGQINMSGVVPLRSPRKLNTASAGPKIKAARSLRL